MTVAGDGFRSFINSSNNPWTDGPTTNTNLGQWDNDDDTDIPFTSNAGALVVNTGTKLYIWASKSFTPGGTVTTTASNSAAALTGDIYNGVPKMAPA